MEKLNAEMKTETEEIKAENIKLGAEIQENEQYTVENET